MAYLGNDLQVAFPTYRNIDDISGSFNGVTTSFPLTVAGVAPIPAPINSQQCLISVNGVVQRPDDSGAEGFRLSGGNIIFASAPAGGVDFFGVILAGADYVNIGANFPSGTAVAPSITFDSDLDTGIYNPAGNQIGFTTSGVQRLVINSSGQISGGLGTAAAPVISFISDPNTGIYSPGADQVAISTSGSGRLFVDASGNVGLNVNPPTAYANYSTLSINGSSGSLISFRSAGTMVGEVFSTSSALKIGTNTGQPLVFETNGGSERLRITSAGLVGVGTSSPLTKLDVRSGVITAGSSSSPDGTEILRGYYSATDGALAVIGTEYSSGGIVIGSAVKPSTSASDAFLSSTTVNVARGAYTIAGNTHKWYIGAVQTVAENSSVSTSEVMRIDSSGRLLVGTSTGPSDSTLVLQGNSSNSTYNSVLRMLRNVTNPAADVVLGSIIFGVGNAASSGIECYTDGQWGTNDYPGRLVFSTTADGASSPTERMRIGNKGRVDCMSTDLSYTVNALTSASAGTTVRTFVGVHSQTGYETGIISFNVFSNGNVTNTNNSYAGISDIKLKENIVNASSQWEDLKALQIRKFNFKKETGQLTHTQIGLIAQETELVSPGLVFETPDCDLEGNDLGTVTKSVNYSVLYMKAVKALQEAMERIEQLEAKVSVLESKP